MVEPNTVLGKVVTYKHQTVSLSPAWLLHKGRASAAVH